MLGGNRDSVGEAELQPKLPAPSTWTVATSLVPWKTGSDGWTFEVTEKSKKSRCL